MGKGAFAPMHDLRRLGNAAVRSRNMINFQQLPT
jgi:hypothetical protein